MWRTPESTARDSAGSHAVGLDDGEREARRTDRLREALRRKCPQASALQADDGARTVLVLESDDIALTNHVLVGECLAALLPERTDLPDEI